MRDNARRLAWSKSKKEAAFARSSGDLFKYYNSVWGVGENCEIRDVTEPFEASLKLVGVSRGRSGITFTWQDDTIGHPPSLFPMFVSDMFELLMSEGGLRTPLSKFGLWQVVKKGANYGIKAVLVP